MPEGIKSSQKNDGDDDMRWVSYYKRHKFAIDNKDRIISE